MEFPPVNFAKAQPPNTQTRRSADRTPKPQKKREKEKEERKLAKGREPNGKGMDEAKYSSGQDGANRLRGKIQGSRRSERRRRRRTTDDKTTDDDDNDFTNAS